MLDQPITSKMITEKEGGIGRLIFNNPARHNAVSLEMWEAVTWIIDDFEQDDAIRVIVVSGGGLQQDFRARAAKAPGYAKADDRDDPRLLHRRRARHCAGVRHADRRRG